jgi:hypothetical protein
VFKIPCVGPKTRPACGTGPFMLISAATAPGGAEGLELPLSRAPHAAASMPYGKGCSRSCMRPCAKAPYAGTPKPPSVACDATLFMRGIARSMPTVAKAPDVD